MSDTPIIHTFLDAARRANENRLLVKFPNAHGRLGSLLEHVLHIRHSEADFLKQLTDAWLLGEQSDEFVALCEVFGQTFGSPATHHAHYMLLSHVEVVSINLRISPKAGNSNAVDVFCISGPPEAMKPVAELLLSGWHTRDEDPATAIYYRNHSS